MTGLRIGIVIHAHTQSRQGGELSLDRHHLLNLLCSALAIFFLAGGIHAQLSGPMGLGTPLALALAALSAVGLQWWVIRSYLASRRADASPAAESSFVVGTLIAAVILLKIVYLGLPDLVPEEAYYWQYAQRPALGYLDHPVMVAWGILAGTTLFGDTEFGVRIFTFLCWLVTAGFVAGFSRDLFGRGTALHAFLLTCLLPYTFLFGFFATPDAPMMASWAGALFYLQRALLRESRAGWVGFGICMGLGMLSKYSMVLLAPAAFAFLLLDSRSRRWFLRPDPYLAIVWAVMIFSPVLIWNYQHDWASFAYQSARRIDEDSVFNLHKLLGYSLALMTPWGVLGAIRAFTKAQDWQGPEPVSVEVHRRRRLFFALMWLVPFSVFAWSSLNHRTKMSWTGPTWLALIPVLAAQWVHAPRAGLAGIRWLRPSQWRGVLVFLVILYAGMFHYMTLGLPGVPYRQRDVKPVAWEELGRQVESLVEDLRAEDRRHGGEREVHVIGTDRFPIASELAFYRRDGERALLTTQAASFYGGDGVMYETWFADPPKADILMLFVGFRRDRVEDPRIAEHSLELSETRRGVVMKRGKPAGGFFYKTGRGYVAGDD